MWQPEDGHHCLENLLEMPPPRSLAASVADKVVRHARLIGNTNGDKIWCADCKLLPIKPVTGRCGHTRCVVCIKRNGTCPCGTLQPENFNSNILVRDILDKMLYKRSSLRHGGISPIIAQADDTSVHLLPSSSGRVQKCAMRSRFLRKQPKMHSTQTWHKSIALRRMATSPEMRYEYARELLSSGRYRDAAAHLAHVAASADPAAKIARNLLAQVITVLCPTDPRRLVRGLYQSVRLETPTAWIDPAAIECPVCYNVLDQPVTTTCGHTFCRRCIKRTMQHRNMCPLCASSLSDFYLAQTDETELVSAVLGTIPEKPQIDPDFIPLFACTVAFPDIPCPLMIFDTDFRNVVRGVLDLGLRRFGMLASLGDDTYANYGTIVEVRDCVVFEDGKSILSTVGVSRFRVLEKVTINGCPYARVQRHVDIVPMTEVTIFDLQLLAQQIKQKALLWLPTLDMALRTDIWSSFGPFPEMSLEGEWWRNPNGPIWLWWLIAILPLRTEIQMLMLSTKHLSKRMTAVLRTLDAMDAYTYFYSTITRMCP